MQRAWSLMNSGLVQKNIGTMLADPMMVRVLRDINEGFADKTRKLPKSHPTDEEPEGYSPHPIEVMFYLMSLGYPMPVVASGGLHDHPEDLKAKGWTVDRIRNEYSPLIGDIVWLVTKPEGGTWDEANDHYYDRLANPDFSQFACKDVDPQQIQKWGLAVCAADKCSNMRASIKKARTGFPTESYLKQSYGKNAERFAKLRTLMEGRVAPLLLREYDLSLQRFIAMGARLASDLETE